MFWDRDVNFQICGVPFMNSNQLFNSMRWSNVYALRVLAWLCLRLMILQYKITSLPGCFCSFAITSINKLSSHFHVLFGASFTGCHVICDVYLHWRQNRLICAMSSNFLVWRWMMRSVFNFVWKSFVDTQIEICFELMWFHWFVVWPLLSSICQNDQE